jgi:hypothetical protein
MYVCMYVACISELWSGRQRCLLYNILLPDNKLLYLLKGVWNGKRSDAFHCRHKRVLLCLVLVLRVVLALPTSHCVVLPCRMHGAALNHSLHGPYLARQKQALGWWQTPSVPHNTHLF